MANTTQTVARDFFAREAFLAIVVGNWRIRARVRVRDFPVAPGESWEWQDGGGPVFFLVRAFESSANCFRVPSGRPC